MIERPDLRGAIAEFAATPAYFFEQGGSAA
jgi:hypothetical protein